MKRTLLIVVVALAVLTGAYGIAWSSPGGGLPPHTDYRTGYLGGCTGGAACHTVNKGSFLPQALNNSRTPSYTNFCLSCHNASGEAHEKSAGSPSTNQYVNLTGINKGASYSGVSHNWKGQVGNAGTSVFPAYTAFTPGGVVECRTCHSGTYKGGEQEVAGAFGEWLQAVDQGDQKSYRILGYASTKQYLAQYLKVFRSGVSVSSPASRAKKAYQIYTGFTYNYQTATITFNRAQGAVGSVYIYANIGQPFLRVGNQSNAACRACHVDRVDNQVSHSPGTGVKDQHPSVVKYGYNFGLSSTVKPSPSGNAYLEYTAGVGNRVLCTSCHNPHNAASKNGQLLREADGSTLCADCHKTQLAGYTSTGSVNNHNGSKHSSATVCLDCHTTHGSNNIMLIKNVINGQAVNFQNFTSFGSGTGGGLCEVCHSALGHHNADGSGSSHNNGTNCTQCHGHNTGFKPNGDCTSCHGFPPGTAPTGWDASPEKHVAHMGYILTKYSLSGTDACKKCHGATIPRANHGQGQSGALIIDTTGWGGGTFDAHDTGKTPADDTCTNVNCHSGSGTRVWGGASSTACDSCHEYPGSATNDWSAPNGHAVRYDSVRAHMVANGYSAATDDYATVTTDLTRCGKCHPNNPNHKSGPIVLNANGYAACGTGNFTVNQTVTRSDVTCSNVSCHGANKTTPNWY